MFTPLIGIQYCYDYLINQISMGLLLYAHIPAALVSLVFGGYLLSQTRNRSSLTLFVVCVSFAGWCFLSLSTWFSFLGAGNTMFTWSLIDMFALTFFFFSYYFLYTFTTKRDLPVWQKALGTAILAPTIVWTFLGLNLTGFEGNYCESLERGGIISLYTFLAEGFFLLAVIILAVVQYRKAQAKRGKREVLLASVGVGIFLLFFFSATLLVSLLVDSAAVEYAYNFEIYGLFGMPVFLIFLGYLVVKYKAFDIKVFTAQALVVVLVVLVGSQFAFLHDSASIVLNVTTFVLVGWIGLTLVRNVRRELDAKERIEALAKDLEKANTGQEAFIHFLSHEVKGYLAVAKDGFASIVEGDYGGTVPAALTAMAGNALQRTSDGVDTVENILKSANLKSGKVTYSMKPFDLRQAVASVAKVSAQSASAKGLDLDVRIYDGPDYTIVGDQENLTRHVIKNLLDNAVNYTLEGKIEVGLSRSDSSILFTVKDSGVGITDEDMGKLFTEGGRGKDATKINAHSTGHGLFIARNIILAHKGKIWAESEGQGKGTTFSVELPVK